MRFRTGPIRPPISDDELALFAEGAKFDSSSRSGPTGSQVGLVREKLSETILFRCTKSDFDEIDFVFQRINMKSRQKLIESILLPAIREIAMGLRKNDSS